jgi:CMP-N-acetylneuraminic acid synthetase
MFEKFNRRIGKKPFVKYIDHFEGHDINTLDDLEIAELIVNSGLYKKS